MFEKRKGTMFARWDRMAKAFTRAGKEIAIACRDGGGDPDYNPVLRRAIQNARAVNMPKDKIERAISKAMGEGATDYAIVIYEGYAAHGVALLVEAATDNTTRTVANVRLAFKKGDGNFGATGSVAYMFDKMGTFKLLVGDLDADEFELDLIDHGLDSMELDEDEEGNAIFVVRCAFNDFGTMQTALEERKIDTISANAEYVPQNVVELPDEQIEEVLELVERLEQDDDVQNVYHTLA